MLGDPEILGSASALDDSSKPVMLCVYINRLNLLGGNKFASQLAQEQIQAASHKLKIMAHYQLLNYLVRPESWLII